MSFKKSLLYATTAFLMPLSAQAGNQLGICEQAVLSQSEMVRGIQRGEELTKQSKEIQRKLQSALKSGDLDLATLLSAELKLVAEDVAFLAPLPKEILELQAKIKGCKDGAIARK